MKRIKVTADDIAKGRPRKQSSCPVARALRRYGAKAVLVTSCRAMYTCGYDRRTTEHTKTVRRAVETFDETGKMKPFTFLANWNGP
jgi:hypothetical protein